MRLMRTDNRKVWSWFLVLALLVMTLPSRASWQCLNGTPCPANCPMLSWGHKTDTTLNCASSAAAHCAHCTTGSFASSATGRRLRSVCATPVCILRYSSQPTSSLSTQQMLTLPLLALPPPSSPSPVTIVLVTPVSVFVPAPLLFYPQRFLRPTSGRAPPVWLV
jgi:hypothetical protein